MPIFVKYAILETGAEQQDPNRTLRSRIQPEIRHERRNPQQSNLGAQGQALDLVGGSLHHPRDHRHRDELSSVEPIAQ